MHRARDSLRTRTLQLCSSVEWGQAMSRSEQFASFFDEFLGVISQHNVTSLGGPPTWAGGGARQFGGGGGCNDAYSAFAFLSFLFALLTFIQNNQAAGGRRRREADQQVEMILSIQALLLYWEEHAQRVGLRVAVLAGPVVLRVRAEHHLVPAPGPRLPTLLPPHPVPHTHPARCPDPAAIVHLARPRPPPV